jgi:hypothetical protein
MLRKDVRFGSDAGVATADVDGATTTKRHNKRSTKRKRSYTSSDNDDDDDDETWPVETPAVASQTRAASMPHDSIEAWSKDYPNLAPVLTAVSDAVALWRQLATDSDKDTNIEYEIRVGTEKHDQSVAPSISPDATERAVGIMQSKCSTFESGWSENRPPGQQVDHFYSVAGIGRVRQELRVNHETAEKHTQILQKIRIATLDLASVNSGPGSIRLRVCISSERIIPQWKVPDHVHPTFCRIKSRREFRCLGWQVDMTEAWNGRGITEASTAQVNVLPANELELELVNSEYAADHSDLYLAVSGINKALFLATCEDKPKLCVVKNTIHTQQ